MNLTKAIWFIYTGNSIEDEDLLFYETIEEHNVNCMYRKRINFEG